MKGNKTTEMVDRMCSRRWKCIEKKIEQYGHTKTQQKVDLWQNSEQYDQIFSIFSIDY